MPPLAKGSTAHNRRVDYISDQLRKHVPSEKIMHFCKLTYAKGEEREMRVPKNHKDFPRTVNALWHKTAGTYEWMLDLIEMGISEWKKREAARTALNEQNQDEISHEPNAGYHKVEEASKVDAMNSILNDAVPSDLEFLIDAIPKLDAMTAEERRSAINYLFGRYNPGRGMADAT